MPAEIDEIDFEDLYSITSQRITIRNPEYLLVNDFIDSANGNLRRNYAELSHAGVIEFPERTRRVVIEAFNEGFQPSVAEITDFNDSTYRLPRMYPPEYSSPSGIRSIRLYGAEDDGSEQVNWWLPITSIEAYDDSNNVIARFDFDHLTPYKQYVLSRPHGIDDQPDSMELHGIMLRDKNRIEDFYYPLGSRPESIPDTGQGTLRFTSARARRSSFPRGPRGR